MSDVTSPIRVLVLFESAFPFVQGGRETGLFHLAKAASELGLGRIDFIVMGRPRGAINRFPTITAYSTVRRLRGFQQIARIRGYNLFARFLDHRVFPWQAERLANRICAETRYTHIVGTNGGPAGRSVLNVARRFGAKSVINVRSHYTREVQQFSGLGGLIYRPLIKGFEVAERHSIQNVDLVLANGEDSFALCRDTYERVKPLALVHNGVDTDRFKPGIRPAGGPVVFFSNNPMRAIKGPDDAIQAFSQMPAHLRDGSRLRLAGGGGPSTRYEELAKSLGLADRVDFLGERPHFELSTDLQQADVAVHPIKFSLGTTHSSLETLATGLPIVAYNEASLRSVCVDGKNGFLVPSGDVAALSQAMARLAADPELRLRMGTASRQMAEAFSWSNYSRRFFKALQDISAAG